MAYTKMFTQKPKIEEVEKRVQFLKNIHSMLSSHPTMTDEKKQMILLGALLYTGLTEDEMQQTILNAYYA